MPQNRKQIIIIHSEKNIFSSSSYRCASCAACIWRWVEGLHMGLLRFMSVKGGLQTKFQWHVRVGKVERGFLSINESPLMINRDVYRIYTTNTVHKVRRVSNMSASYH